ncbi:unnamed protein product, partial [Porites lobata]
MVILILQTQKVEANVACELPTSLLARDCIDLLEQGFKKDGVYHINPDDRGSFHVFCDQTTNGGGWIVFQKRFNGSEDFHRNLSDYKNGFGNLNGEFWLGNDRIHRLTDRHHQLLVELDGFNNITGYAQYETFSVDSEENGYKIHLGPYSGAWWHDRCNPLQSNLNGGYFKKNSVLWLSLKGYRNSLKSTSMKIRSVT